MAPRLLGVSAALVEGELLPGDVELDGAEVVRVGLLPAAGGRIAVPGFVDLQVNGFAGVDVMAADADDLVEASRALARHGVTAWLPTLITADPARTDRALRVVAQLLEAWRPAYGARPLGVHLEGPFLHPERLGTHPGEHRRDPSQEMLQRWLALGPVAATTLAPELPGAMPMIRDLARRGVLVSLGHSDATAAQAHAGFDAGARTVTHLFNAMSPLRHRAPGLPGVALARRDVTVQLIVDGHHLDADVVRLAWAAAAGRVVLVTDATAAAGPVPGPVGGPGRDEGVEVGGEVGGVPVTVHDGAVRNREGALAGSALTLDAAVRGAVALGIDRTEALAAASIRPARLVGDRSGGLRPGDPADVVVLEPDLTVAQTWVAGRPAPGSPWG